MASTKIDRRTERTRTALMTAFVDQILTRGYDAVTVEDIVAKANVGRSTFYTHYRSKEGILKQSLTRPSSFLAVIVGGDIAPDMLLPILEHFREQRRINRAFFLPPIRSIWVCTLAEMIEPRLARLSGRTSGARPALPLNLVALQLAEAQIALIVHWLTASSPCRAEIIAESLVAATHAGMSALLRWKFDTPPRVAGERLRVEHRR